MKTKIIALILFIVTVQFLDAQTATGSMKINFQNFQLSADSKKISYDVYVQDVDASKQCGIMGYTIRVQSPQTSLGSNAKTVTVTNANAILGAGVVTMSVTGSNWMIKFSNTAAINQWAGAQILSETFPGTMLATVNIVNTDPTSSFSNPQSFNVVYSSGTINKSILNRYLEGTNTLASDAATAIPLSQFNGIGTDASGYTYSLQAGVTTALQSLNQELALSTTQTSDGFYVNGGNTQSELSVFDLGGRQLISAMVIGRSYIDISRLNKGVYVVKLNGQRAKILKL